MHFQQFDPDRRLYELKAAMRVLIAAVSIADTRGNGAVVKQ